MTHYHHDPKFVRVDFFKPSGKWYQTISLEWVGGYERDIHTEFEESLRRAKMFHPGFTAVCLEPNHQHAHPLMLIME